MAPLTEIEKTAIAKANAAQAHARVSDQRNDDLHKINNILEQRLAGATLRVTSEPRTYDPGSPHSWFADMFRSERAADPEARKRLGQHAREAATDAPRRAEARRLAAGYMTERALTGTPAERRALEAYTGAGGVLFERRALTRVDGDGGYLVPPAWLIDRAVPAPRADSALADAVTTVPLPQYCDTVNLPTVTTGTAAGLQTADAAPAAARSLADAAVSSVVRSVAGNVNAAAAWVDQGMSGAGSELDALIWDDLQADLRLSVDGLLILGSGTNGQTLGLFPPQTTVGTSLAVYAPTTATVLYAAEGTPALGLTISQAVSGVTRARSKRPTHLLTAPWVWDMITSQVDGNSRPLVEPKGPHPVPEGAEIPPGVVGYLGGLPVLGDLNVPDTFGGTFSPPQRPYLGTVNGVQFAGQPGTGGSAVYTPVVPIVAPDLYVFMGEPKMRLMKQVLSGSLQYRFQLYCYLAIFVNRYQAVASGTLPNSGGWTAGATSSYGVVTAEVSSSLLSRTGMGFEMAVRKQAQDEPQPAPAAPDPRDVTLTALARVVGTLAIRLPGAPATLHQILTGQLGLTGDQADAFMAAHDGKPRGLTMRGEPDPAYPFGQNAITPHRENAPRTQCRACAGGGDLNDLVCPDCGGLGYFDVHNPAPAERR